MSLYNHLKSTIGFRASKHAPNNSSPREADHLPYSLEAKSPAQRSTREMSHENEAAQNWSSGFPRSPWEPKSTGSLNNAPRTPRSPYDHLDDTIERVNSNGSRHYTAPIGLGLNEKQSAETQGTSGTNLKEHASQDSNVELLRRGTPQRGDASNNV